MGLTIFSWCILCLSTALWVVCKSESLICESIEQCRNTTLECSDSENDNICQISCSAESACQDATIICPDNSICEITCDDYKSCYGASIFIPSTDKQVSIYCSKSQSCRNTVVNTETANVNETSNNNNNNDSIVASSIYIECSGASSCRDSEFTLISNGTSVICSGDYSCHTSIIDARDSIYLNFTASGLWSTEYADLYVVSNGAGPYITGYASTLNFEDNVYCGDSLNIYAIEGYHDIILNAELANMLYYSYMYCGLGYNYSCEILYYDDEFGCAEGASGLIIYENCETWILGTWPPSQAPIEVPTSLPTLSPTFVVPNKKVSVTAMDYSVEYCDVFNLTCSLTTSQYEILEYEWIINGDDGTVSLDHCSNQYDYNQLKHSLHNGTMILPHSCISDSKFDSEILFECYVTVINSDNNLGYGVANASVYRGLDVAFEVEFDAGNSYVVSNGNDFAVGLQAAYSQFQFSCNDEIYAFDDYVEYNVTQIWYQITSWNDTLFKYYGNSTAEILQLLGWTENSVELATNDLIGDNGMPYTWTGYDFAWETMSEGEYYLFLVCEYVTLIGKSQDIYCDFLGIYVEPATIEVVYDNVVLNYPTVESITINGTTNDYYVIDLTDYINFPVDDDEIDDRYTFNITCVETSTDLNYSICDSFEIAYIGIVNGTLIVLTSGDMDFNQTYTFIVVVIDDEYDEVDDIALTFTLTVWEEQRLAVTVAIVDGTWYFESSESIILEAIVSPNEFNDSDVELIYTWYATGLPNGIFNISEDYLTQYDQYLIVSGSLANYLNDTHSQEFTVYADVRISDSSYLNGTGWVDLAINDAPSNGTCELVVNSDDGIIYALEIMVTVKCSNWYDSDGIGSYTFDLVDDKTYVIVKENYLSSEYTFFVGYGNYTIIAEIYDSLGAMTSVEIEFSSVMPERFNSTLAFNDELEDFMNKYFYTAANYGDLSSVAMSSHAVVSIFEYVENNYETIPWITSYNNDNNSNSDSMTAFDMNDTETEIEDMTTTEYPYENMTKWEYVNTIYTEMRTSMLETIYDLYTWKTVGEDNIEQEMSIISTIVRYPSQIESETGKECLMQVASIMDSLVNLTDNGVMNDDTANLIGETIIDVSQAFVIHIDSYIYSTSYNTINDTEIARYNSTLSSYQIVDLTILMLDLLLIDKLSNDIPGASGYQYESEDLILNGKKFDSTDDTHNGDTSSCADSVLEYSQSSTVVKNLGIQYYDCLFIQTTPFIWTMTTNLTLMSNPFNLDYANSDDDVTHLNGTRYELISDIFESIIYSNDDNVSVSDFREYVLNAKSSSTTTRTSANDNSNDLAIEIDNLETCNIFVFTMEHNEYAMYDNWIKEVDEEGDIVTIPLCQYYDFENATWSTEGCWAVNTSNAMSQCACNHLSAFAITAINYTAQVDVDSSSGASSTSSSSSFSAGFSDSEVWIIVLLLWIIFLCIILCISRENDKPMAAQLRPWSQLQQKKWAKFMQKKQNDVLLSRRDWCSKWAQWYFIYFKNNHPCCGICLRDLGTNWTSPQRVFCVLVSVITIAEITAAFYYGDDAFLVVSSNWFWNLVWAAFFAAFVGLVLSCLFVNHTPAIATGKIESHTNLCNVCIGRFYKVRSDARYDDYYGFHSYHNQMIEGKHENSRDIMLNEEQIEYDILGLYAKNDIQAIKSAASSLSYQVDSLRLNITATTETLFGNGVIHHTDKHGNNKSNNNGENKVEISNEKTLEGETLKNIINKHLNQTYAHIAALNSIEKTKRSSVIYAATDRTKHGAGAYASVDRNGNIVDKGGSSNLTKEEKDGEEAGHGNYQATSAVGADSYMSASSVGTPAAGGGIATSDDEIEMQSMEKKQPQGQPPQRPPAPLLPNYQMNEKSKESLTIAKRVHIEKINASVNYANHMLVPTLVVPNLDSEDDKAFMLNVKENATDNEINNGNESQNAITDANNKKQALLNSQNWYDEKQYDIYFESRQLLPEENAALTLIQANLVPYEYWWPHCLSCFAWIIGIIWIIICSYFIILYSGYFEAYTVYTVSASTLAATQSDASLNCSAAFLAYDVELIDLINYEASSEYAITASDSGASSASVVIFSGWEDVSSFWSWFFAFMMSILIWILLFIPLFICLLSCLCFCMNMWKEPKPRMYYYHGRYDNHEQLLSNIKTFENENDIWNAIASEITEVEFDEYPYWVLHHPYVLEMRRHYALLGDDAGNAGLLPIHSPSKRRMSYEDARSQDEQRMYWTDNESTKLTAYFDNNRTEMDSPIDKNRLNNEPNGFELKYTEYPIYYDWDDNNHKWKRKPIGSKYGVKGRMEHIEHKPNGSTKDNEEYYIRILLDEWPGATSFKDLRTINTIEYKTFEDAVIGSGLLNRAKPLDNQNSTMNGNGNNNSNNGRLGGFNDGPIQRLDLHLPSKECIKYETAKTMEDQNALASNVEATMLVEYFVNNRYEMDHPIGFEKLQGEPNGYELKYFEYPLYYNWNQNKKIWERRKTPVDTVGRIPVVLPATKTRNELYYLRLLLLYFTGGTSFRDMKTINLIEYKTYEDACIAAGLITPSQHSNKTKSKHDKKNIIPRSIENLHLHSPERTMKMHEPADSMFVNPRASNVFGIHTHSSDSSNNSDNNKKKASKKGTPGLNTITDEEMAANEQAGDMFSNDEIETTRTKLTEFFRNNRIEKENESEFDYKTNNEPYGFQLKYYDYPIYYHWKNFEWIRRNTPRKDKVGRVPTIFESPIGESYYIRKLLFWKSGPTSYQDLKRVNGTIKPTFRDACDAAGLLSISVENNENDSDDSDSDGENGKQDGKTAQLNDKYASVVKHTTVGDSDSDENDENNNNNNMNNMDEIKEEKTEWDDEEADEFARSPSVVAPLPTMKNVSVSRKLRNEDSMILESLKIRKTVRDADGRKMSQSFGAKSGSLLDVTSAHGNAPTVVLHTRMATATMTETEFDSRLRRFANFASIHDYDEDSDVDNLGYENRPSQLMINDNGGMNMLDYDENNKNNNEAEPKGTLMSTFQMSITQASQASAIESDSEEEDDDNGQGPNDGTKMLSPNSSSHAKSPSKARQLLKFINEKSGSLRGNNNNNNKRHSASGGGLTMSHHNVSNSLDVVVTDVVGTYNGDNKTKFTKSKNYSKRHSNKTRKSITGGTGSPQQGGGDTYLPSINEAASNQSQSSHHSNKNGSVGIASPNSSNYSRAAQNSPNSPDSPQNEAEKLSLGGHGLISQGVDDLLTPSNNNANTPMLNNMDVSHDHEESLHEIFSDVMNDNNNKNNNNLSPNDPNRGHQQQDTLSWIVDDVANDLDDD